MFNIFSKKRKPGVVYWVDLNKIKIQPSFQKATIGAAKYQKKLNHYLNTGEFESTIYLAQDNTLLDGYSSYLIAKQFDLGKIPVVYGEH